MNKKLSLLVIPFAIFASEAFAKDDGQYPNLSGKSLFEVRADRASTKKPGVEDNNLDTNIDADFDLKFSKNWSLISNWRVRHVDKRSTMAANPERYREILSTDRGFAIDEDGLIIEQLKGQFENEDARFFFGKFNPAFGTAHRKEKRIGVFTTDFTKDYEIREKIGAGFTALLEKSELTIDAFFNDTTPLSDSAFEKRGKERRSTNLAGNTSGPSSYTVSIEGEDLFGINDLFYNFGYRNLAVDDAAGFDDETGLVGGLEYLFPIGAKTSLIPFVEIAEIKNFSGIADRNARYATFALIAKYSSWSASVANVSRDIKSPTSKYNDHQIQYSIGYKFTNNVAVDLSKANIKEDGYSAHMVGLLVSYVYNF